MKQSDRTKPTLGRGEKVDCDGSLMAPHSPGSHPTLPHPLTLLPRSRKTKVTITTLWFHGGGVLSLDRERAIQLVSLQNLDYGVQSRGRGRRLSN